jgi:hypothetical protein
MVDHPLF